MPEFALDPAVEPAHCGPNGRTDFRAKRAADNGTVEPPTDNGSDEPADGRTDCGTDERADERAERPFGRPDFGAHVHVKRADCLADDFAHLGPDERTDSSPDISAKRPFGRADLGAHLHV